VKALQIILEKNGYQVIIAYDGSTGFAKVKEEKPDLVLLDIMLPDMDGYQVCELIKKDPALHKIPVMMLTAKAMGDDVEKALEKRADWYITKPFEHKYLLKKIEEFVK
jgi:DNA-binding response OmpR family regulator